MSQLLFKQFMVFIEEDALFARTAGCWISDFCSPLRKKMAKIGYYTKQIPVIVFAGLLVVSVFFPTIANADIVQGQILPDDRTVAFIIEAMKNETRPYGRLPQSVDASPRRNYRIPITAYTSDVAQTDDTPCITASGLDVCERGIENIVAANFLPMGTRVRIPELYGDRIFYVEDRMNERYFYKMDIWMKEISDAKQFGVKYMTVEVF